MCNMHIRRSILTASPILALSLVGIAQGNLITNGDFSNGLTGWSVLSADTDSSQPDPSVFVGSSGDTAGALTIQNAEDASGSGVEQTFSIGDADAYTFEFDYGYSFVNSESSVELFWQDANGDSVSGYYSFRFESAPETDEQWPLNKSITMERGPNVSNGGDIPENAASATISLKQHYTGYQTFYDNVSFEAVPEPASLSLALLGGVTLLGRRRRN
jgi:hypothetical protein